jgi:hypothetical protein
MLPQSALAGLFFARNGPRPSTASASLTGVRAQVVSDEPTDAGPDANGRSPVHARVKETSILREFTASPRSNRTEMRSRITSRRSPPRFAVAMPRRSRSVGRGADRERTAGAPADVPDGSVSGRVSIPRVAAR